jgi:hypothetical protein
MRLPLRIPHISSPLEYKLYVVDGTFSAPPYTHMLVDTDWDYATFTSAVCQQINSSYPSFNELYNSLKHSHAVNMKAFRIFIIEKDLPRSIIGAISLLCDADDIINTMLPEVTGGGLAHNFPLKAMIPTPNRCDILIMPGIPYRRRYWKCNDYLRGSLQYTIHCICAPWYATMDLSAYAHVHMMPYYGVSSYMHVELLPLETELSRALESLWQVADGNTRAAIEHFHAQWGINI